MKKMVLLTLFHGAGLSYTHHPGFSDADVIWFYTRNGLTKKSEKLTQNEMRIMTPPAKWEDAILILD